MRRYYIFVKLIVFILFINYIDIMKITFRQLEVFVFIAKLQNMSAAAQTLALSQSACSMALTNLESQLNTPLFDRLGKKLLLNAEGKAMLVKADNILAQVKTLETSFLSEDNHALIGNINIGASSTIGNYILPTKIARFTLQHPNVNITLSIANTENIINNINQYNIDIGLIEGPCYHPDIKIIPWKQDELIIVASPDHPLAKKHNISLADIKNEKWIFREIGSGTRELTDQRLQGNVKPFLTLGNTEAIKQAVIAGFGISCVSKISVSDAIKEKKLVQLDLAKPNLNRALSLIIHRDKYQTIVLKKMIDALMKD